MPPSQDGAELVQLGVIGVIVLVVFFYGGTMLMSLAISRRKENADAYMTAGNKIGFGVSAASMTVSSARRSGLSSSMPALAQKTSTRRAPPLTAASPPGRPARPRGRAAICGP